MEKIINALNGPLLIKLVHGKAITLDGNLSRLVLGGITKPESF